MGLLTAHTHRHTYRPFSHCVPLALIGSVCHSLCDLGQVLFLSGPASTICTMMSLHSIIPLDLASLMSSVHFVCGTLAPFSQLSGYKSTVWLLNFQNFKRSWEFPGPVSALCLYLTTSPKVLIQPKPTLQE